MMGKALPYSDLLGSFPNEIGLISSGIEFFADEQSDALFPNNQSILSSLLPLDHKSFSISMAKTSTARPTQINQIPWVSHQ